MAETELHPEGRKSAVATFARQVMMRITASMTWIKSCSVLLVLLFGSVTILLPIESYAQDKELLLFGVVPQQAASRLAKMWDPFVSRLSKKTGLNIQFATMKDIPSFENCLAQGAYDIAYMNPYHYTYYSERSGYQAFAHQVDKKLKGIVVTKADSPVQTVKDLDGKKVAFPSHSAFGASVIPRAEMRSVGVKVKPVYVKSHDSVYRSVAAGFYTAGGGVLRTFNSIPEELQKQLRIIHTTKGYSPHAYAARTSLGPEKVKTILNAMMEIEKESPELLEAIGMKGFQTATDNDWDDVKQLNLDSSDTQIVQHGDLKCRFD